MFEDKEKGEQRVFDSSHFIGARLVENILLKRRRMKDKTLKSVISKVD